MLRLCTTSLNYDEDEEGEFDMKFMKALKFQYTGSAVRASDVMTVPD